MKVSINVLGTTAPNSSTGNPGQQTIEIKCEHYDGNVEQLSLETRNGIQHLFDNSQLKPGIPVLVKDGYSSDGPTWNETMSAIIASTATATCVQNDTPQALFITEENKFLTQFSNNDSVPVNSWFDADGVLLKDTKTGQINTRTSAQTENKQQQAVGATQ